MAAPDGDDVRNLRDCIRAFDQSAAHALSSVRELLLAGRCLFDVAIECVDRLNRREPREPQARKVDVQ